MCRCAIACAVSLVEPAVAPSRGWRTKDGVSEVTRGAHLICMYNETQTHLAMCTDELRIFTVAPAVVLGAVLLLCSWTAQCAGSVGASAGSLCTEEVGGMVFGCSSDGSLHFHSWRECL